MNGNNGIQRLHMDYSDYIKSKYTFGIVLLFLLILVSLIALCSGSYYLTPSEILSALIGSGDKHSNLIIWNMRLPRIAASIIAGLSLAVAGCETSISIGIDPQKVRFESMLFASMITAICVSFLGIRFYWTCQSPYSETCCWRRP